MREPNRKRVVITGLGVVSCLGVGTAEFWKNLMAGKSGIGEISAARAASLGRWNVGEVKNFKVEKPISHPGAATPGLTSQFAATAALLAMKDAGLHADGNLIGDLDPDRVAVIMGTTTGEQQAIENAIESSNNAPPEKIFQAFSRQIANSAVATNISDLFGFGGYSIVLPAACSGGNYAIAHAFDLLRDGRANIALAGGADCLSRHFLYGFARLGALASERCQPFDKNRKGIIPGEGAGVLVVETLDSARKRKAQIYSEVLGYGLSSDAHHPVAPDPEGKGAARAMKDALERSNVSPESVRYISAHGTGTIINDSVETKAIKSVFGECAYRVPISSVKAMLGHAAGAASAIEAVVCNLAIHDGAIPPTINYEAPDPECDLDYVPNVARSLEVGIAMNNSCAFLGSNASVVFSRLND